MQQYSVEAMLKVSGADHFAHDFKKASGSAENMSGSTDKASASLGKLAIAGVATVGVAKGFQLLKASVGEAVSRFDTLEKFPKVLQSLGVSAGESEKAMSGLSDGITGLPTHLDDIAQTAQRMYTSFQDMDKATDSAIALNNALLGSGASADEAKRGTEMYLKALQTGKMDMVTWRTLSETMNVGLEKVADGFGMTSAELYDALQSSEISMKSFNDKMVELGTGTGIMAELAQENSEGISNSFANLKYATAMGIADIIKSFDKLSQELTGKTIAQNIDGLRGTVHKSFKAIQGVIESSIPVIQGLATVFSVVLKAGSALTPVLIGIGVAMGIHKVINITATAIQGFGLAMKVTNISTTAYNVISTALIAKQGILAGATAIASAAQGLFAGTMTVTATAGAVLTGAMSILSSAITFLSGPVGWVVAGFGALVGATVGLVKWLTRTSDETQELMDDTEAMNEANAEMIASTESSAEAYEKNLLSIESNAESTQDLMDKVIELSEQENLSAGDKELLAQYTEDLNESVDDLNLSYDEESEKLNMSSDNMQARLNLFEEQEIKNVAMERTNEILEETNELEAQLEKNSELRQQWNQDLEDGSISAGKHKKETAELDETEQALKVTLGELKEEYIIQEDQVEQSMANIARFSKEATDGQLIDYERLNEANQKTVDEMKGRWDDLQETASNAFEKISEDSSVNAEEMLENLRHNQELVAEWGVNVAELHDKAGEESNEGFLAWLDSMGPDTAAELAVVNDMTDDQLDEFVERMNDAPELATDGFSTSLGEGGDDIIEDIGHLVTGMDESMTTGIEKADFPAIARSLTSGLEEGIEAGTVDVIKSSERMADDTNQAVRDAFEISSPSKVFNEFGLNLTDGMALGISEGSQKVVSAIKKMFSLVNESSTGSFAKITTGYKQAISNMENTLMRLPKMTLKHMTATTEAMKTGTRMQNSLMGKMNSQFTMKIIQLGISFDKLNRMTKKTFSDMGNTLRAGSNKQKSSLSQLINLYNKFGSRVGSSLNKLNRTISSGMNSMNAGLRRGSSTAQGTMKTLRYGLVSPFNGIRSLFYNIGSNAMGGLQSGLNARSGNVMGTARSIANRVTSTIRGALRIASDSKEMIAVGGFVGSGLITGMEQTERGIKRASLGMAEAARMDENMFDMGASVRNINKKANRQFNNNVRSEINIGKQPAIINVNVGSKQIASEIVDDITGLQDRKDFRGRKTVFG